MPRTKTVYTTARIPLVAGFRTFMFSDWHHNFRIVYTDGRKLPNKDEVEPKFNGYSVGKWQGNTFVVDSVGFDPRTWLDHNGYPHTEEMRLQERYRLIDADTLELRMTITDPEFYAQPFQSDVKLFRRDRENEKGWDEQIYCVPSEEQRFNRLIRDGGVQATVVFTHWALREIKLVRAGDDNIEIYAEAGIASPKLARFAALHDAQGAEFLAGIPGTVGGALAMNILSMLSMYHSTALATASAPMVSLCVAS